MKAVVYDSFGTVDVLQIREVPEPVPARGEALIRVRAAALNPKDVVLRRGRMRFIPRRLPTGIGHDWAGEVVAVGPGGAGAFGYGPGDKLWGMLDGFRGASCAEYLVAPFGACARMPARLSFVEAAALPLAGQTALQALRDLAHVGRGSAVCLHGASGGVGTLAIQIARSLGARVTTTSSAANFELCKRLGADETFDYADPRAFSRGHNYDAFFDIFGNRSFAAIRPALAPRGTYVTTVPSLRNLADVALTRFRHPRARMVVVRSRAADLDVLAALVDAGQLKPVVDRIFSLHDVRAAAAYLETKRARGKIIIQID